MKTKRLLVLAVLSLLGLLCARADNPPEAAEASGAIYTMDNAATANHVLVLERSADGSLAMAGSIATGGAGAGSGLSSQGSVLVSREGRWLFVCNAGSSEISVFSVSSGGLTLSDKVNSGGKMPVSLAFRHNLLYVLNAGGAVGDKDNVTGFVFAYGKLVHLPQSSRALSGDNTGPAEAAFTSDGEVLLVTERMTSVIDTYVVGDGGLLGHHQVFASSGQTPFGFAVGRRDRIYVSEAAASTLSSYQVSEEGELSVITASAPTKQTAACWAVLTPDGRFVYTANAGSGSISGFAVSHNGSVELLTADGRTGVTGNGSHPVDMVVSRDNRFLYSLDNGNGSVSAFRVNSGGSLSPLPAVGGLPTTSSGLAGH